jgi:hypothetical protein
MVRYRIHVTSTFKCVGAYQRALLDGIRPGQRDPSRQRSHDIGQMSQPFRAPTSGFSQPQNYRPTALQLQPDRDSASTPNFSTPIRNVTFHYVNGRPPLPQLPTPVSSGRVGGPTREVRAAGPPQQYQRTASSLSRRLDAGLPLRSSVPTGSSGYPSMQTVYRPPYNPDPHQFGDQRTELPPPSTEPFSTNSRSVNSPVSALMASGSPAQSVSSAARTTPFLPPISDMLTGYPERHGSIRLPPIQPNRIPHSGSQPMPSSLPPQPPPSGPVISR